MIKQVYGAVNCSRCGKWVGKDGFLDIGYNDETGTQECGYPLCKRCLDEQREAA